MAEKENQIINYLNTIENAFYGIQAELDNLREACVALYDLLDRDDKLKELAELKEKLSKD